MSARVVVKRECSRCPRIEEREISLEEAVGLHKTGLKGPVALKIMMKGEAIAELEDLCDTCTTVVLNYIESATKKLQHRSALRTTEDGVVEELEA